MVCTYKIMTDNEAQSIRFEMRAAPSWLQRVDDWRRQQSDIPSRAEAIRRLVDKALQG